MKCRNSEKYDYITVDVRRGGYNDIRLVPCYMVFSSLILFLAPHVGMMLAIVFVGVPSFIIAKKVARMQPKVLDYNFEAWDKDRKTALEKGLEMPELGAYAVMEQKPAKLKVTKRSSKPRSRPTFEQLSTSLKLVSS